MKRYLPLLFIFLIAALFLYPHGCSNLISSQGQRMFSQAQKLETNGDYLKAIDSYELAYNNFIADKEFAKASQSRNRIQNLEKIVLSYPYTADEAKKALLSKIPALTEKGADEWLQSGKLDSIIIGGKPYYFIDIASTVEHLDLSFLRKNANIMKTYRLYAESIQKLTNKKAQVKPWKPFINPVTYNGNATLNIPRNKLPQEGIFQLWAPLPIETNAQTNCQLKFAAPESSLLIPPQLNNDLGTLYMSFKLGSLKNNLKSQVKFTFTHFEQRLASIIDSNEVGKYDVNSGLYKTYTASERNIYLSPEITQKANLIVGDETNPYFMAKKIYEHVVEETTYSAMPHIALDAKDYPESQYVLEHKYGDCGGQSMYFAALCRAVGIPARTPGGWQMISGKPGTHFWAEFYLPHYGWVPVDTSVAQIYKYLPQLDANQQKKIKDYYFGNLDPYRLVIQNNVDLPLVPSTTETLLLTTVIQTPAAVCPTMDDLPGLLVNEYWDLQIKEENSNKK